MVNPARLARSLARAQSSGLTMRQLQLSLTVPLTFTLAAAGVLLLNQPATAAPSKNLRERGAQNLSQGRVPCAARDIAISNYSQRINGTASWTATCGGQRYLCATVRTRSFSLTRGSSRTDDVACHPAAPPANSSRSAAPTTAVSPESAYDERRSALMELCLSTPSTCDDVRICLGESSEARAALLGDTEAAAPPFDVCAPLYRCALLGNDCYAAPDASQTHGAIESESGAVFASDADVSAFCESNPQHCGMARRCASGRSESDCQMIEDGRAAGLFE